MCSRNIIRHCTLPTLLCRCSLSLYPVIMIILNFLGIRLSPRMQCQSLHNPSQYGIAVILTPTFEIPCFLSGANIFLVLTTPCHAHVDRQSPHHPHNSNNTHFVFLLNIIFVVTCSFLSQIYLVSQSSSEYSNIESPPKQKAQPPRLRIYRISR